MFQVVKRDGQTEPFDMSKVVGAVMKANGTEEVAQQVAAAVEAWLPTVAQDEKVTSLVIRDKVLEVLEGLDPTAAQAMREYTK